MAPFAMMIISAPKVPVKAAVAKLLPLWNVRCRRPIAARTTTPTGNMRRKVPVIRKTVSANIHSPMESVKIVRWPAPVFVKMSIAAPTKLPAAAKWACVILNQKKPRTALPRIKMMAKNVPLISIITVCWMVYA